MDLSNSSHRLGFAAAVLIIVAAGAAALYLSKEKRDAAVSLQTTEQTAEPRSNESAPPSLPGAQEGKSTLKKEVTGAVFSTSQGEIEVIFFPDKAPKTVANFIELTQKGFYDGTKFHRVIKDFMIQGGDPFSKNDALRGQWGTGGPGYQFDDEINSEKLVRGVLAMANAGPNTNGSQFFIVTAVATPWLDGRHTVFGRVVNGIEAVDAISAVPTGEREIPQAPVVVKKIILKVFPHTSGQNSL